MSSNSQQRSSDVEVAGTGIPTTFTEIQVPTFCTLNGRIQRNGIQYIPHKQYDIQVRFSGSANWITMRVPNIRLTELLEDLHLRYEFRRVFRVLPDEENDLTGYGIMIGDLAEQAQGSGEVLRLAFNR